VTSSDRPTSAAAASASSERLSGGADRPGWRLEDVAEALARAWHAAARLIPALAWRIVLVAYLSDALDTALTAEGAVDLDAGSAVDRALLFAWLASVHFRRGETDLARIVAARALTEAEVSADETALAAAHDASGVAANQSGDLRAAVAHYDRAITFAERAGDRVESCRAHNNRGSTLLEQGRYTDALDDLNQAIDIAEVARLPKFQALALMNRGLANWCLGRLDEANADYQAAIAQYGQTGSREISYAIIGRGDVYRERGDLARARGLYEEGLALGELSGDRQALVPGLYQLAKVLVDDEPERAIALAQRAIDYGWPDPAWALNALGWIVVARGDLAHGRDLATRSEAAARARNDQFGLAESLELAAMSDTDAGRARDRLGQALAIWREIGNPVHQATTEIALARAAGGPSAPGSLRRAERRLAALGVRPSPSGPAGLLRMVAATEESAVSIETLGGFRVRSAGRTVTTNDWGSRKARDLVKILLSHRGRPVPREVLVEALWPDEEPSVTSNRLSVALSTVRKVLDPGRRFPADHLVGADRSSASFSREHAVVDVEVFLQEAIEGLDLLARGRQTDAVERLADAEALYAGDFLEEDQYEDWSVGLREEARATYLRVAAALADLAAARGDHESAIRYHLRLIERDRFDETAHLALVRSLEALGRRGEARRRYRLYESAMDELGVPVAEMPPPSWPF
jgi:DNA-binding SARP family transcriptional activator/Tfp pilus assembly protein PilF